MGKEALSKMKKFNVFVKQNFLSLILGLVVVFLAILLFTQRRVDSKADYYPPVLMEDSSAPMSSQAPGVRGDASAAASEGITFCFRLDGQENKHLPALMGNQGQAVYDNNISGVNWILKPGASGSEDYGVLADGRVFAKAKFLELWGMQSYVEIKSDKTGWQAVRMEEINLDGELAYIY